MSFYFQMTKRKRIDIISIYGSSFLLIAAISLAVLFQYQPTSMFAHLVKYENWFPKQPLNGFPPENMNACAVILGAKLVGPGHPLIDPLAALSGARHLFLNYFLNQTDYGIIEGGFTETDFGYRGLSTAHVKPYAWDHGGFQWPVPTNQCEKLIHCLQIKTILYQQSSFPYHFLFGPNSNSFMWWIFNQCSIQIIPTFTQYPFVGIDYFWSRDVLSKS